jgi:hypothetical protein
MSARIVNVLLLIATLGITGAAQSRPDLSGTWVPVDNIGTQPPLPPPTPDGPPPPPPPPRTISLTIAQSPAQITVDRRVDVSGQETVHTFLYRLDGTDTVNQMGVLTFRTRASWDADSLVLSSTASAEGNAIGDVKETYRMVDGNLLVETTRRTPTGTFTSRTVHARRR